MIAKIGDTVFNVGPHTYGHMGIIIKHWPNPSSLSIGDYCSIADGVTIFLNGNHRNDWISTYPFGNFWRPPLVKEPWIPDGQFSKGDVTIENDVWIGHGVVILSGVTLENGAVIAARSVVSRDVGAYELWAGNPARMMRKRFDDDTIHKLEVIQWWNWPEKKVQDNVHLLQSDRIKEFVDLHYGG